jgi:hypothetical protein
MPKKVHIDSDEIEFLVNGGKVYGVWAEVSPAPCVLVKLGPQEDYRPITNPRRIFEGCIRQTESLQWENRFERRDKRIYTAFARKGSTRSTLALFYPKETTPVIAIHRDVISPKLVEPLRLKSDVNEEQLIGWYGYYPNDYYAGREKPEDPFEHYHFLVLPEGELEFRALINERFWNTMSEEDTVGEVNPYFRHPGLTLFEEHFDREHENPGYIAWYATNTLQYVPDISHFCFPRELALPVGAADRYFPALIPIEVHTLEEATAVINLIDSFLPNKQEPSR